MNKKIFLFISVLFVLSLSNACDITELNKVEDTIPIPTTKERERNSLSLLQAEKVAELFSDILIQSVSKEDTKSHHSNELDFIDLYIENGDTLMYAVNYANNEGYIIIGAANNSFPILAHATHGSMRFSNINKNSAVNSFLVTYKNIIKKNMLKKSHDYSFIENWSDIGREGYEYEISISIPDEITDTKARRDYSSGKKSIYPYTGIELDCWSQRGGYNYFSKNGALIGCPAIAIGMLMYDTSQRLTGNTTSTLPLFDYYYDAFDISNTSIPSETGRKLREIADSIPNYDWGTYSGAESGALPDNILIGLHNLGYKNATLNTYNFEALYNQLTFSGYNYFGEQTEYERGVLLAGYQYQYVGGHIWFCDGYYEQEYTVTKKFLGIVIKRWKEYDDRLYMNWGWGNNSGNGWYCATDNGYWSSLDKSDVNLKFAPKMFINLDYYENTTSN